MDNLEQTISLWHNHALDFMLNIYREYPSTRFWLRRKQKNDSKRLDKGFWFQGGFNYIAISPYREGDGDAKIKSIAFIIEVDRKNYGIGNYLQIVFGDAKNKRFYKDLPNYLEGLEEKKSFSFRKYYRLDGQLLEAESALRNFWKHDKPLIDKWIEKHDLQDDFYIEEEDFKNSLKKTLERREDRLSIVNETSNDPELKGYEGKIREFIRKHRIKERDTKFVAAYKNKYRHIEKCPGCDLNTASRYLLKPIEFFELHHIIPFSEIPEERKIKEKDMVLLCPNCHRAIHKIMSRRKDETIDLNFFKKIIQK